MKLVPSLLVFAIAAAVVPDAAAARPAAASVSDPVVTFSICRAVVPVGHADFGIANLVGPSPAPLQYFMSRGQDFDRTAWKVTLIEGPRHGMLVPNEKFPDSVFVYQPNEGYLGPDQMIFVVEAQGKKFKVIESVYVSPGAPEYGPPECPNGFSINELPSSGKASKKRKRESIGIEGER